jgi:hypothetical protein
MYVQVSINIQIFINVAERVFFVIKVKETVHANTITADFCYFPFESGTASVLYQHPM